MPPKLYKFLEPQYAAALRDWGSVRIGTLGDFGNTAKHGHGVLDQAEGAVSVHEYVTSATYEQMSAIGKSFMKFEGDTTGIRLSRLWLNRPVVEDDLYVYCLSFSDSWASDIDPKYTVCMEIFDVNGFVQTLADTLARLGFTRGDVTGGPVKYIGREHHAVNDGGNISPAFPVRPAFMKERIHAIQKEYRIIFTPVSTAPIKPENIRNPKLSMYCRTHSTRPI